MTIPSLFVSHGAPTLPFDDVPARAFLKSLGEKFDKPKGIVIASAHWETRVPAVNGMAVNGTIHDFYGFPKPLYELQYPAPGSAALTARVADLLGAVVDAKRGLDHGAWVPLMLMYPAHDIPVAQVAVQTLEGVAYHIEMGRRLAPLRDEGILVIGSGSFVHNLRLLDRRGYDAPQPDWSKQFSDWMNAALLARDDDALTHYRERAPHAAQAHPEEEHLLPLFVAYGAGGKTAHLHDSTTFGSLRMDAYSFA
ncbi:MAG TPA: class III extradiol ring-cleavage dioxygenase [Rhizomicrobium sp.]|nr:class III extradiol ring-cleavage dioxygenase [Rhizomicrobium sp.]